MEAVTEDDGFDYTLLPQHISFITFPDSYADAEPIFQRQQLNLLTLPQIVVYSADAYAAMHELAGQQIEQLQALLAERPSTPGDTLPYLPLVNAAQILHSQVTYLDFANGAGVRYLTKFPRRRPL